MNARPPMVLLDDARSEGAADALLFERPERIFVARTPQEVVATLEQAESARVETGQSLAGYVAYEAGLALEPRLAPLAALDHARSLLARKPCLGRRLPLGFCGLPR